MKTRSCVPNGRGHPSRSQLLIGLLRVDSKKSVQEKNAHVKQKKLPRAHGLWTPNEAFFHQNPTLLGLGTQFEAFRPVCYLSMFFINQPLFLQKTKPLFTNPKLFIWHWDLNLGHKEFGI
jgi:hypothetical protein